MQGMIRLSSGCDVVPASTWLNTSVAHSCILVVSQWKSDLVPEVKLFGVVDSLKTLQPSCE